MSFPSQVLPGQKACKRPCPARQHTEIGALLPRTSRSSWHPPGTYAPQRRVGRDTGSRVYSSQTHGRAGLFPCRALWCHVRSDVAASISPGASRHYAQVSCSFRQPGCRTPAWFQISRRTSANASADTALAPLPLSDACFVTISCRGFSTFQTCEMSLTTAPVRPLPWGDVPATDPHDAKSKWLFLAHWRARPSCALASASFLRTGQCDAPVRFADDRPQGATSIRPITSHPCAAPLSELPALAPRAPGHAPTPPTPQARCIRPVPPQRRSKA